MGTAGKWAVRPFHYRMSQSRQDQDLTRASSSLKHTLQGILHRTHRKPCWLPLKSPYPRSAHSIRRHPYPTRKGPFPFCFSLPSLPIPLWCEKQNGGRECKEGDGEEKKRNQGNGEESAHLGARQGREAPETAPSSECTHGRPLSFLL